MIQRVLGGWRDFRWVAGLLAALVVLLFGGEAWARDARDTASGATGPAGTHRVYLPLVVRDDPMRTQRLCRFGIGAPWDIVRYPVNDLRIGWYTNWGSTPRPDRPGGIEYLQMVRLGQTGPDSYTSVPQGNDLLGTVSANPGALWIIGNEPDRRKWQDSLEPGVYAHAYHDLYYQIKAADPTARIAAGSIVQPTPIRRQYLDMVLSSYQSRYGQAMPVDVWNIHAFILNEVSCNYFPKDCWGADVPPGIDVPEGMRYSIEDSDNLAIFKQFIVDFRQWMADRGYKERPLIITEYGLLYQYFPPTRVNAYMNATFDYLSTAAGSTGYSADKGRLVQAWAWYSLADQSFGGWLYDPQTLLRSVHGDNFVAYTSALAPVVNLAPVKIRTEPVAGYRPDQQVRLVAQVSSTGNITMYGPSLIRFYAGDPAQGGMPIGNDAVVLALNGCGNTTDVAVIWNNPPMGASTVWAVVDPFNTTAESDETDNRLSAVVSVSP